MRIDLKVPYQDAAKVAKLHREGARYERPTKTWYFMFNGEPDTAQPFLQWMTDEAIASLYPPKPGSITHNMWSYNLPPIPVNAPTPLTQDGSHIWDAVMFLLTADRRKQRDTYMKVLDDARD